MFSKRIVYALLIGVAMMALVASFLGCIIALIVSGNA
jgi:tetrahydromethanopterin S-methyltransferase subunit B